MSTTANKPAADKPAANKPTATPAAADATQETQTITANVTIEPTAVAPEAKLKGKTVKVEVVRSHPSFGYFAGDKAEISEENFKLYGTGAKGGEFFKKAE